MIWAVCDVLYAREASPVLRRLANGCGDDACAVVGACLMVAGITLKSGADLQKTAQKHENPHRFCDKGLYSFVRCPNYPGEVLTWTGGMLVSGATACSGAWQWAAAIAGWVGIVYVMFGDTPARAASEQELRRGSRVPCLREEDPDSAAVRPALQRSGLHLAQGAGGAGEPRARRSVAS